MDWERWNCFVVSMFAQLDRNTRRTRTLVAFSSKTEAADYIFKVTGMHVNDDWSVTFIEPKDEDYDNGEWAGMYIEGYVMNEPDDGTPDWSDLDSVEELLSI